MHVIRARVSPVRSAIWFGSACPVVSLSFDNKALYRHGSCLGSLFTTSTGANQNHYTTKSKEQTKENLN